MRTKVHNKINTLIKKPHLKKGFPIKMISYSSVTNVDNFLDRFVLLYIFCFQGI